jgi:uncharacterized membrane protein SpoIIM required for sporulation/uncharacterized RDD family membrane protein YckC
MIETPEHVVLGLELAGLGSRLAAAALDALFIAALSLLLLAALQLGNLWPVSWRGWYAALLVSAGVVLLWGYFVLFEGLGNGRTPGKRSVGIRVVMDTGHPVTFGAAVTRNLMRLVDAQPAFSWAVGLVAMFAHPHNKRLGDLAAGTIVIRDRPEDVRLGVVPAAVAREGEPVAARAPELDDAEYRLLEQFLARAHRLADPQRRRLAAQLARRFAARVPQHEPDPERFLEALHAAEFRTRRGPLAARRPGGAAGAGRTALAAERFAARKQAGWEAFRALAARAERAGLASLGAAAIPGFAARYREVAADLARARTYGVDPRVLDYLERAVAAGHHALYGARGLRRPALGRLLCSELPAAVVQARAYVLAALLAFAVPALSGYVVVRERPAAASEILPDGMIARARTGWRQRAAGRGYAEAPSPYLPLVASGIVANNVQIAFGAFALGITAGVGTVLVLAFNGAFFGAVLGLFANYGLGGWLLTFVAGHGVLELTAIFIAGGAGLRIGHALIAPGDLRRRDALVAGARTAVRLVGAATALLVLAGAIEGFLSASDAAPAFKYAAGALSALLVALVLACGRRSLGTAPGAGTGR